MRDVVECKGLGHLSRRAFLARATGTIAAISSMGGLARAQTLSPKVLRYSDHEPLGNMRTRFTKDILFPAIERQSGGRLRVEDQWNGELAGAYQALGIVGNSDTTDIATVVPEYTANELPLHQIFKSFPMGPTGARQVEFFRRVYQEIPEFSDELVKNDLVAIYFGTGYPVAFYSTAPIEDLSGVVGGRWRTASFWHRDFLSNAGATPVSMHWGPEVYAALSKGELNGLMVNIDSGYDLKVHEAAPNILASKDLWLGHLYLLTMKKSVWDGLAADEKDMIQRGAEEAYRSLGSTMDASFDAQVDVLRRAGANVRVLHTDEARAFQAMTQYKAVQAAWAEQQRDKGLTQVGPVLDKVSSVMSRFMD